MKTKILNIEKKTMVASGEPFLEATVQVMDGSKVLDTKVFGYPADTTAEAIREDAKKYGKLYVSEIAQREKQQVEDAHDAQAQKTISTLHGEELEIGADEPKAAKPKAKAKPTKTNDRNKNKKR